MEIELHVSVSFFMKLYLNSRDISGVKALNYVLQINPYISRLKNKSPLEMPRLVAVNLLYSVSQSDLFLADLLSISLPHHFDYLCADYLSPMLTVLPLLLAPCLTSRL